MKILNEFDSKCGNDIIMSDHERIAYKANAVRMQLIKRNSTNKKKKSKTHK